nr:hypothetical protein GCM10020093_059850 [Planobispora longispora]
MEADVAPRDDQPAPRRGRTRKAGLNPEVSLGAPEAETIPELPGLEAPFQEDEPVAPAPRPQPEKIVPASPFMVIFQSPDLATDDDEIAPSAASERVQNRRRSQPRSGGQRGPRRGNQS